MANMFNDLFRPLDPGMCRLSPKGIAVKTSSGFTAYNRKTGRLINCDGMVFDLGPNAFFAVPTNKVRVGDIIIDQGKPACVTEVRKDALTVLNYEANRMEILVPCRHIFMEQVYFYQKIVSLFGDGSIMTRKKGISRMMQLMMLSQVMKGNGTNQTAGAAESPLGALMPLLLIKGMGEDGLFDGIAEAFDPDDDEEEDEDKEDEDFGNAD